MMNRVVVTGMGIISPIGNSVEEFWNSAKEGRVGIGETDRFDTTGYKATLAAEVKDFDPLKTMDRKEARRMALFSRYAVAASAEAMADSGLEPEKEDPYRIGVLIGSGIGGLDVLEDAHEKLLTRGPGRVPTLLVPMMIGNMAGGNVAIHFGLKGKCIDIVTACATGNNCIGEAFRSIQHGELDVCLAGGTEAAVTPVGISGFTALTALSTSTDPLRASIPFDKDRGGFVMGEGAGVVVLESYDHAKARGARILAEVAGYGATCDAYHITSPEESGEGAARAMTMAISDAGLSPEDVDYVNAHGTGTHHNDLFETRAIKKTFGDHAKNLNINSTKSMVGHMLGAAGAVEFIACVKTIQDGFIHATAGFREAEEEMDLNYTPVAVNRDVRVAISNSLGFGGHNATLLVKKFEEA
ncbi:MAG: beta-ketoacyl-ACP synthase II [Clostridiales bacterium]|nr:beta-ketoacyl-ACP synthase II [Clostridiales bacterium]